jgi:glycerophosphoryl diester phosphodiesterase
LHSNKHAENSLGALQAAAAAGLDGVEFDVRFAADGVAVLAHDSTLLRTHGDARRIDALTSGALRALGVPRLVDALAALPAPFLIDLELKEIPDPVALPTVFDALLAQLRDVEARLVVSSFSVSHLQLMRALAPSVARWLNVETGEELAAAIKTAHELDCCGVALSLGGIDRNSAAHVRDSGLELAIWTLCRRADLRVLETPGLIAACVEGEAAIA